MNIPSPTPEIISLALNSSHSSCLKARLNADLDNVKQINPLFHKQLDSKLAHIFESITQDIQLQAMSVLSGCAYYKNAGSFASIPTLYYSEKIHSLVLKNLASSTPESQLDNKKLLCVLICFYDHTQSDYCSLITALLKESGVAKIACEIIKELESEKPNSTYVGLCSLIYTSNPELKSIINTLGSPVVENNTPAPLAQAIPNIPKASNSGVFHNRLKDYKKM